MGILLTNKREISRTPIIDPTLEPGIDNVYKGSTKINKGEDNGLKLGNLKVDKVYNGGSVVYQREIAGTVHNYDTVVMEYEADYYVEVRDVTGGASELGTLNQRRSYGPFKSTITSWYSNSDWIVLKGRASNTPVFLNIHFIKDDIPGNQGVAQEQEAINVFFQRIQLETVFGVILNGDPFRETREAIQGSFCRKNNDDRRIIYAFDLQSILFNANSVSQITEFTNWMNIEGGNVRKLEVWGGWLGDATGKFETDMAYLLSPTQNLFNKFGTGLKPVPYSSVSWGEIKTKIRWQQTFTVDRGATPNDPYPTN